MNLWNISYYLVWCTRRRRPFLEAELAEEAKRLLTEEANRQQFEVLLLETRGDHAVMRVKGHPFVSPAYLMHRLKQYSARCLMMDYPGLDKLPSVWTRHFYCSTDAMLDEEEVAEFVQSQPRSERRGMPQLMQVGRRASANE